MILAIDIGNTNIVVGCIDGDKTHFIERVSTDRSKTELEYAIVIRNVLEINHVNASDITGGIVCSVVPQITQIVRIAAEKILKKVQNKNILPKEEHRWSLQGVLLYMPV